jgi:hypothetical protein
MSRFIVPLEPRVLLSGNVTALVINGDLLISGGRAATTITVNSDRLAPGEFRVIAEDFSRINDQGDTLVLSGVIGDIRINLRGGDDRIRIDEIEAPGSVSIGAGRGNDIVLLTHSRVAGKLKVTGGGGHDSLNVTDCSVSGNASISAGGGNDILVFDGSSFDGFFSASGGRGLNTSSIARTAFNDGSTITPSPSDTHVVKPIRLEFDFNDGDQGWKAGFSDYPAGSENSFALDSGIRKLPGALGRTGQKGFFITGANHSDDLFMYLKRLLRPSDGIVPGQSYQATYDIVFASAAPEGCAGIGGSPGNSVWLKAGITFLPPSSEVRDGSVKLSIDKGNQSSSGVDASVAGTISNAIPCDEAIAKGVPWRSVHRRHIHAPTAYPLPIRGADLRGRLFLLVGTDSGYEGTTTLYYKKIIVNLTPVAF